MPTPQDIWIKLPEGKYNDILSLIKENKELLNISSDTRNTSLFQSLLTGSHVGDECKKLLEYMIQHPDLNWGYTNKSGNSNTFSLIKSTRTDLLLLAVKNPCMLLGGEQLAYEVANGAIASTQESLQAAEKRNPNATLTKQLRERLKELPSVIALLRDATVLYALEKDDADVLTRLNKAGGDPTEELGSLGGGKYLNMLVTAQHTNIKGWLTQRNQELKESLYANPHSLFAKSQRAKDLEIKKSSLEQQYLKDKVKLIHEGLNEDSQQLNQVVAQIKPGISSK